MKIEQIFGFNLIENWNKVLMILKFFIHFFLIIAITLPAVSEMKLQRFSISTYSNSGNFNNR